MPTSSAAGAAPAAAPARRPGYQAAWLGLYWSAAGLSAVLLLVALLGDDVPPEAYLVLVLGLLATGLGSAMATHLFVRRVDDVGFDRGTEWARAVSIGWWLLAVVLVVLAFQISGGGVTRGSAQAADVAAAGTDSLTAELIGAAALLGVLGPGYSAYRTALAEAPPRTPTTS